jgi:predicted amidohydrolase
MRVVCCQTDIVWEDPAANHARVAGLLEANPPEAGSLVVLPEMFATGFSMRVDCVAEDSDGETHRFLASLARQYGCTVLGGVVTRAEDGRGSNDSIVFASDGAEVSRYRKMRPFCGGEQRNYAAGCRTAQFTLGNWRVSHFVCYDLRFPELFRSAARNGTDLFTVIASWPVARIHHWVTLLQARAIENQAYVVGVNRVGDDPALHYNGRSIVVGPGGDILLDCGETEAIRSVEIDLEELREYRKKLPFLADLHPDYVRLEDAPG